MKHYPENEQREVIRRILQNHGTGLTFTAQELRDLMQEELEKPYHQIDNELVDLCSQAICEMRGIKFDDMEQAKELSKTQLLCRIADQKKKKAHFYFRRIRIGHVVALALSLMLLLVMADILLNPNSILHVQSPDGEDYILQGTEQESKVMPISVADTGERVPKEVSVTDLSKVFEELGYQLPMPTWMPENSNFFKADVIVDSASDDVTLRYKEGDDRQIIIGIVRLYSPRGTSTYYEQNEPGKTIMLSNGDTAYIAQNVDVPWGLYESGDFTYHISCKGYDEDTLIKIMNSIGEIKE